jgi:predicted lipid-binding transport protein (Tim44 family)
MSRAILFALPLLISTLPSQAFAFGGGAAPAASNQNCEQQNQQNRSRGRSMGGMLGGLARGLGGSVGGVAGTVTSMLPVAEMLGEAIAAMLDCHEQQQAATATETATRGGVGTTSTWTSQTRPGVTGSSTVTAASAPAANGAQCLTVTDVVIVDGQETRAPKRMCRTPPSNRYVRQA